MKISLLLILIRETDLSPERLAKRLRVSHMTVRRWMKKSPTKRVRSIYDKVLPDAIYQLVQEGILTTDSESYKLVLRSAKGLSLVLLRSLRPRKVTEVTKQPESRFSGELSPGQGADPPHPKRAEKPKKKIVVFRQARLEMG